MAIKAMLKLSATALFFYSILSICIVSNASSKLDINNFSKYFSSQSNRTNFKGNTVYSDEELLSVIKPALDEYSDLSNEKLHKKIMKLIRDKYNQDGYIISYVHSAAFNKITKSLYVNIIEGRINDIIIEENLLKIKYVKGYVNSILDLKPFNINKAMKYFLLIKQLLGERVDFKMKILDQNGGIYKRDITKNADLICNTYYKYEGIFSIHNYQTPKDHKEHYFDNALMTRSDSFTMGNLSFRVANPFNTAATSQVLFATSGDDKENRIFLLNKYQINSYGTKLVTSVGYDRLNYKIIKETKNIQLGIEQPIQIKGNTEMFLFSNLILNHFKFNKKSDKEAIYSHEKNKNINTTKLYLGTKIKKVSSLNAEQNYYLIYHIGKARIKEYDSGVNEFTKKNFSKFTLNADFLFKLSEKLKINFEIDGQYANKNIPRTEDYSQNNTIGGKGMLHLEVSAPKALTATLQLSHYSDFIHPLFVGFNKYVYYENGIASIRDTKNSKELKSAKLSSIGLGGDLYLVDNLVFNVEINHRIDDKNYDKELKKLRLFAGLNYFFLF